MSSQKERDNDDGERDNDEARVVFVLKQQPVFDALVSLFGVSDFATLEQVSHRFKHLFGPLRPRTDVIVLHAHALLMTFEFTGKGEQALMWHLSEENAETQPFVDWLAIVVRGDKFRVYYIDEKERLYYFLLSDVFRDLFQPYLKRITANPASTADQLRQFEEAFVLPRIPRGHDALVLRLKCGAGGPIHRKWVDQLQPF